MITQIAADNNETMQKSEDVCNHYCQGHTPRFCLLYCQGGICLPPHTHTQTHTHTHTHNTYIHFPEHSEEKHQNLFGPVHLFLKIWCMKVQKKISFSPPWPHADTISHISYKSTDASYPYTVHSYITSVTVYCKLTHVFKLWTKGKADNFQSLHWGPWRMH